MSDRDPALGKKALMFDPEGYRRSLEDRDLMLELISIIGEDAPLLMEELRVAFEKGDAETLAERAHGLKGMIGNYSAPLVYEQVLALEVAARAADLAACRMVLERLEGDVERLISDLREFGENL